MPFDPNIALQTQGLRDPLESYGKALTLKGLGQQQQMQAAQMAKFEQDQAAEARLNDVYRGSTGVGGKLDRNALYSGVAQAGLGSRIPGLQKSFADADKSAAETQKMSIEKQAAGAKLISDAMSRLASNPNVTHRDVIDTLAQFPSDIISPEQSSLIVRQLPGPDQLRQTLIKYGASADQRLQSLLPQLKTIDAGNRMIPGTQSPETGAFTAAPGAPITKAPEGYMVGPDGRLTIDPGFLEGKSKIAKAGAPVTNLNVNTEKSLTGKMAGNLAEQLDAGLSGANSAVDSISSARNLKQILASGKVITGPGADARVQALQVGRALGIVGKDADEVLTNTRQVIQSLAAGELEAAKGMKGQGAMSDSERALLKRVAGGDITMTTPELTTLANAIERSAMSRVKSHQANVERLKGVPGAEPLIPFYQAPQVPADPNAAPPAAPAATQPAPAASWKSAGYSSEAQAVQDARSAIAQGADKAAVIQRLEQAGIKNHGLR